ncbi:MAG: AraC family transcriptional regulator [Treponema sp.]|jgi:AraC-like DNA-binding protein|nr:AraC family transcriptional regulator [Treponema sp.]
MPDKKIDLVIPEIGYLVYRKCTPSWTITEQVLKAWDLTYVIRGNAKYTIDGSTYMLAPGDLLCLPAGTVRQAVTWPDRLMNCFSVNFQLNDFKGRPAYLPFPVQCHLGIKDDIVRLFHELCFTWLEKQPGYNIKAAGHLLLILSRFYELIIYNTDSVSRDPRINKVIAYIAAHYSEKITLKKMAGMLGLNCHYLGSLFKSGTGDTFNRYLVRTRIRHAENMLKSGEFTVQEVSDIAGFSDSFYFYKKFKSVMGFPPSYCIPKRAGREKII